MAKMTLTDLLPALLGLGIGAASPKAGQAGATTLDMFGKMKDQKRQQGRQDVADERAVLGEARAVRGEARADESAQRAGESHNATMGKWTLEQDNRAAAQKTADAAIAADPNMPQGTQDAIRGMDTSKAVNDYVTEYPMNMVVDEANLDTERVKLKRGETRWMSVRWKDGSVSRYGLRNEPESTTGQITRPQFAAGMGVANDYLDAKRAAGTARSTLEGQAFDEASDRRDAFWKDDPPIGVVRGGRGPTAYGRVGEWTPRDQSGDGPIIEGDPDNDPTNFPPGEQSVPRLDTAEQRGVVAKADNTVDAKGLDLERILQTYPEIAQAVMQLLAREMGEQTTAPTQGKSNAPGTTGHALAAKWGAAPPQ